jgi:uncharacterized repeat protein (TIGR02543 family)
VSSVVVTNGYVSEPADPTRDGYEFAGWYTDEACTSAFDFGQPVSLATTLYAKWNPIVTFNSMGGSDVSSVVVTNGYVSQPTDPTRDGYTFNGWYTNDACTDSFSFSSEVASPLTLYAGWT